MDSKSQRATRYMVENPPSDGEIGYYARIGKLFGLNKETVRNLAIDAKIPNVRPSVTSKRDSYDFDETLANLLHKTKRKWNIAELSDHFECGVSKITDALHRLRMNGKNIEMLPSGIALPSELPVEKDPVHIDTSKFLGKTLKFGVTGDNHLCSKYERLDVLNALFDIWEREGVTQVLQCGNMIDGEARFNRYDLKVHGMDAQVNYFIQHWPKRKGIVTRFVAGDDHEGWYVQNSGTDIGKYIERAAKEAGRTDLEYLGYMERNLHFVAPNGVTQVIRIMHAGGGAPYALSYVPQKIVESLQGGEKPTIILIGHHHKYDVCYPREVTTIMVGCTQDQTPFMRKKKIGAHIGGVTLEVTIGKDGLFHNITHRWHPFFDRDFYEKAWSHKG